MRKKYRPKTKQDLRKLILNEEIELADIDTSKITDMSHLFEPTLRGGDQARFFFDASFAALNFLTASSNFSL